MNGNEPIALLNDITIKIDDSGVAFSLRSRDFKDPQTIAYSEDWLNVERQQRRNRTDP